MIRPPSLICARRSSPGRGGGERRRRSTEGYHAIERGTPLHHPLRGRSPSPSRGGSPDARRAPVFYGLTAFVLLLLAAPAAAQQFDPFHEARIDQQPGAAIPLDGTFLDRNGKPVTLKQLADGKPLLLVPVLHECPNFCSVTLAGVTKAIAALPPGTGQFATVAFGIDPKEGPAQAKDDLSRVAAQTGRKLPPETYALTGQAPAIHQVTDALGYHYAWDQRIGQYAHAAAFAVITPSGKLSRWFYGLSPDPAELAQALQTARQEQVGSWAQQLLLICFHYDPQTGHYTASIMKILRLAGVATLLGIGLIVFLAQRRRRAP